MLNLKDYRLDTNLNGNPRREKMRTKVFFGIVAFYYASMEYRMNLAKERLENKPGWEKLEKIKDALAENDIEVKTEDLAIPESKLVDMIIATGQDTKNIQKLIMNFSNIEVFDIMKDTILEQGVIEKFGHYITDAIENSAIAIMAILGNMKLKKFRKAYGFRTIDGKNIPEKEVKTATRLYMREIIKIGSDVLAAYILYVDSIRDAILETLQHEANEEMAKHIFGCNPKELRDNEEKLALLCTFIGKVTGTFNDWYVIHPEEAPDDEYEDLDGWEDEDADL